MLGRIVRSADFERVLGTPACARSPHFAVHFLDGQPSQSSRPTVGTDSGPPNFSTKLSTDHEPRFAPPVDDCPGPASLRPVPSGPARWLGTVVPKRHAKRAVTRSLLKRHIRAALLRLGTAGQPPLQAGLWVVRLRAPFDRAVFASAASAALRSAARGELDALLAQAAGRLSGTVSARLGRH